MQDLQEDILPVYLDHENEYDPSGVHGRIHICRTVIFAEFIARFYHKIGYEIDFTAVRYATAFHDSGREGHGRDIWECNSADLCYKYLENLFPNKKRYANNVSKLIINKNTSILSLIVNDADVLDIMRPCCGHGGYEKFNKEKLFFLSTSDRAIEQVTDASTLREKLISEAWTFIQLSENEKYLLAKSTSYMNDLLKVLNEKVLDLPLINSIFFPDTREFGCP